MTIADIFLLEFNQFVPLKLKTSKTDVNHTGRLIVMEAVYQQHCLVTVFCKLFFKDPKLANTPLFSQTKRAFSLQYLINKLKSRLVQYKIHAKNYLDNSFWCGEPKYASDCRKFNQSIQKLERLISNAYQLYFIL